MCKNKIFDKNWWSDILINEIKITGGLSLPKVRLDKINTIKDVLGYNTSMENEYHYTDNNISLSEFTSKAIEKGMDRSEARRRWRDNHSNNVKLVEDKYKDEIRYSEYEKNHLPELEFKGKIGSPLKSNQYYIEDISNNLNLLSKWTPYSSKDILVVKNLLSRLNIKQINGFYGYLLPEDFRYIEKFVSIYFEYKSKPVLIFLPLEKSEKGGIYTQNGYISLPNLGKIITEKNGIDAILDILELNNINERVEADPEDIRKMKVQLLQIVKTNLQDIKTTFRIMIQDYLNTDPEQVIDTITSQAGDDLKIARDIFGRKIADLAYEISQLENPIDQKPKIGDLEEIKIVPNITSEMIKELWDELSEIIQIIDDYEELQNEWTIIDRKYFSDVNFVNIFKVEKLDKTQLNKYYNELLNLKNKYQNNLTESKLPINKRVELIKKFIQFSKKELGLQNLGCKIKLTNDKSQTETYGHFDPSQKTILVYNGNRSLGDVLRTLSHELVHRKQDQDGKLTPQSGETGSSEENEANSLSGVLLRKFGGMYPVIFENKQSKKSLLNEIKVIGSKQFPENERWFIVIENEEKAKLILSVLKQLGYRWNGAEDINIENDLEDFRAGYTEYPKYPIIIVRFVENNKDLIYRRNNEGDVKWYKTKGYKEIRENKVFSKEWFTEILELDEIKIIGNKPFKFVVKKAYGNGEYWGYLYYKDKILDGNTVMWVKEDRNTSNLGVMIETSLVDYHNLNNYLVSRASNISYINPKFVQVINNIQEIKIIGKLNPLEIKKLYDKMNNFVGRSEGSKFQKEFREEIQELFKNDPSFGQHYGWGNIPINNLEQNRLSELYQLLNKLKQKWNINLTEIKVVPKIPQFIEKGKDDEDEFLYIDYDKIHKFCKNKISNIDINYVEDIIYEWVLDIDYYNMNIEKQHEYNLSLYEKLIKKLDLYAKKYLYEIKIVPKVTFEIVQELISDIRNKIREEEKHNKWTKFWDNQPSLGIEIKKYYEKHPEKLPNLYRDLRQFKEQNNLTEIKVVSNNRIIKENEY